MGKLGVRPGVAEMDHFDLFLIADQLSFRFAQRPWHPPWPESVPFCGPLTSSTSEPAYTGPLHRAAARRTSPNGPFRRILAVSEQLSRARGSAPAGGAGAGSMRSRRTLTPPRHTQGTWAPRGCHRGAATKSAGSLCMRLMNARLHRAAAGQPLYERWRSGDFFRSGGPN